MAAVVEPPELARLLDYAERPRAQDWSLRAALTRYAQPQPQRVSDVLEVVRRIDSAFRSFRSAVEKDGEAVWRALQSGGTGDMAVELLRAMQELDRLADVLVAWAIDRHGDQPDAAVDATVSTLSQRLDALGVPREERQPPARGRRPQRQR